MSGAVSLTRPGDGVVLREFAGDVPGCAPDAVFAALVERLDPRGASGFIADSPTSRIVTQGGYWYRGEYTVEPTPGGSVVRLAIVNIAPGLKLLGALTGHAVLRAAPGEFAALVATVRRAVQPAT